MTVWVALADRDDPTRGLFQGAGISVPCQLGRHGLVRLDDKKEGDGKTPLGNFPMRRAFYRPDRMVPPSTKLPSFMISPDLAWCVEEGHRSYNQLIRLPFGGAHQSLWQEGGIYDLGVTLGFNDSPVVRGAGSALFLHCSDDALSPTDGSIALKASDLALLINIVGPDDLLSVQAEH